MGLSLTMQNGLRARGWTLGCGPDARLAPEQQLLSKHQRATRAFPSPRCDPLRRSRLTDVERFHQVLGYDDEARPRAPDVPRQRQNSPGKTDPTTLNELR